MGNMNALPNKVGELMKERHVSLRDLEHITGIQHSTLGHFKNGERGLTVPNAIALCEFFNCSLDYLFCRTTERLMAKKLTDEDIYKELNNRYNQTQMDIINLISKMSESDLDNIKELCETIVDATDKVKRNIAKIKEQDVG